MEEVDQGLCGRTPIANKLAAIKRALQAANISFHENMATALASIREVGSGRTGERRRQQKIRCGVSTAPLSEGNFEGTPIS